jgi:hypothetical protein
MVLTGRVKRVFRSLWVLAANEILVRLLFSQLFGEPFNHRATQSLELWLEFLLKAIVPVLGIVLELAGWRFFGLGTIDCCWSNGTCLIR